MPLYEYSCQECGEQAELLVKVSGEANCPKCGSAKMSRLLSIVASPSRGAAGASDRPQMGGSCGAGCGCHPH
jgi:putative FmdB family regulatory protein